MEDAELWAELESMGIQKDALEDLSKSVLRMSLLEKLKEEARGRPQSALELRASLKKKNKTRKL